MNIRDIDRLEQASRMSFACFDEDDDHREVTGGSWLDFIADRFGSVRGASAPSLTEAEDRP